jgi:type VI secretion system protein ImpA
MRGLQLAADKSPDSTVYGADMPSPTLLDLDSLLAPIPGDSPEGGPVPFAVREKLEEDRKEINPDNYRKDDVMRPEAKKADWVAVSRLAQETLTETSKDLLVAARLVEALARDQGYGGLRDGLRLMRRLVVECWDRLQPPIESEEDLEVRAAPFYWLDDVDRGARFPNSLRQIPMIRGDGARYSWFQWKQAQTENEDFTVADIERAVQAMPREECQAVFDDLTESWTELDALAGELNGRLGQYAPGLTGLRQAIGECRALAQQVLDKKGPDTSTATTGAGDGQASGGAAAGGGAGFVGQQMASRAQVYQQLAHAAAMLQKLEPHSPIPYLINRAVELGGLPFPELMQRLIRNSDVLSSMNRELGIKQREEE